MKLQDYIQYYIGCEVIVDGKERAKLIGGSFVPNSCNQIYYDLQTEEMKLDDGIDFAMPYNDDVDDADPRIKPILRKLSDITNEEDNELEAIKGARVIYRSEPNVEIRYDTPDTFHWMLKKQFDLFELIENGLAIDSKTLK